MASGKREVNVVFLGPTGCGKSRLCNVLLQNDTAFQVSCSLRSFTKGIQSISETVTHNNQRIVLKFIETKGLADTTMTNDQIINIVKDAIKKNITFVNYFVIMLKPGRLTDDNLNALECIIKAFKLDDENRKKHVLFVLSHCEWASTELRQKHKKEWLHDRTIKRLLMIKDEEIKNCYFTGLPQLDEVDESMHEGIMKQMESQRKELMSHFCQPIEEIKPIKGGIFANICTIL
jgi:predicted GTPase